MKTNRSLLYILLFFVLISCDKQEFNYFSKEGNLLEFTASNGSDTGSKTVYNQENMSVLWMPEETIKVFCGDYSSEFVSTNTEISESATFIGSFSKEVEVNGNTEFWAVYPSGGAEFSKNSVITEIQGEQRGVAGSFDNNLLLTIAKTRSNKFLFKNICGGIKFSIGQSGIKKVVLRGNNNEAVAGKISVGLEDEQSPEIQKILEAKQEITLNAPDNGCFVEGSFYYIILIPQTFSDGFTLTLYDENNVAYDVRFNNSRTIKRSVFSKIQLGGSIDEIEFEDENFKSFILNLFDFNKDGRLTKNEALEIRNLEVFTDNIESIAGVENFANLESLSCYPKFNSTYISAVGENWHHSGLYMDKVQVSGKLLGVDLSQNIKLRELTIMANKLSFVDLGNNFSLKDVNVSFNHGLKSILLPSDSKIESIEISATGISQLDLSAQTNLKSLVIDGGEDISQIDFSKNQNLENLSLQSRGLSMLDISSLKHLKTLNVAANNLETIVSSGNPELELLDISYNRISNIDLKGSQNLLYLYCTNNCLSHLNLSNNVNLKDLFAGNYFLTPNFTYGVNTIENIDVKSNTQLERLDFSNLPIKSVTLNNLPELKEICFCNTNLEKLDVSGNTKLSKLDCSCCNMLNYLYVFPNYTFQFIVGNNTQIIYKSDKVYASEDFSRDGESFVLQKSTRGNGINIVMMGDAFSDRLIDDGTYRDVLEKMMEAFFMKEPYKTFRDCFNVYGIYVVSGNEDYEEPHSTALSTWFSAGTHVGGNDDIVIEYISNEIPDIDLDNSMVIVAMNRKYYAGTCYMYTSKDESGSYLMRDASGFSIAYFPLGTDSNMLKSLVCHEASGHGFGKLADEYFYENNYPLSTILTKVKKLHNCRWYINVDTESNPSLVLWSRMLGDSRYSNQGLGVFEGAYTYISDLYRSTENSMMNNNEGDFNAPSREAIYYRINKLAFGDNWQYDYEEFVAYDQINLTKSVVNAFTPSGGNRYERLSPPVLVERDLRQKRSESKAVKSSVKVSDKQKIVLRDGRSIDGSRTF